MVLIEIVPDDGFAVYPSVIAALSKEFITGVGNVNRESINKISIEAEKLFRERIVRPETSRTLGGAVYRPGERQTGHFTFGAGKTFTGSLIRKKAEGVGFAYPIVGRADNLTDRAWRGLEYGWSSMKMPSGDWRNAQGQRVPAGAASNDQFFPRGGGGLRRVRGIEGKHFISDAFDHVVKTYTTPAYEKAQQEAVKKTEAKFKDGKVK